jgi:hypothetical protein
MDPLAKGMAAAYSVTIAALLLFWAFGAYAGV